MVMGISLSGGANFGKASPRAWLLVETQSDVQA